MAYDDLLQTSENGGRTAAIPGVEAPQTSAGGSDTSPPGTQGVRRASPDRRDGWQYEEDTDRDREVFRAELVNRNVFLYTQFNFSNLKHYTVDCQIKLLNKTPWFFVRAEKNVVKKLCFYSPNFVYNFHETDIWTEHRARKVYNFFVSRMLSFYTRRNF